MDHISRLGNFLSLQRAAKGRHFASLPCCFSIIPGQNECHLQEGKKRRNKVAVDSGGQITTPGVKWDCGSDD